MCDEKNFTMEKKVVTRQSPCGSKNNIVASDKKCDYVSNKNGRQKKHRDPSNGGRFQDPVQQPPRAAQKYNRGFGDKRPRQRGYTDYRQSEEIAESLDLDFSHISSRKASGNANHLLRFSYSSPVSFGGGRVAGSWGGRKVYRHQAPSYKKEQFLQASCQFVAQEDGDYSQQAINPDALVDWDNVQLVRTFSSELITCPICLDVPIAGKITRCGHTYCWGCILHYLQVNDSPKKDAICPVCPESIDADKLRSVQNVLVPDFKVGDEIEMKLMRKKQGSVFICPQEEWAGNEEKHLNIGAGDRTNFSKLLTMTWAQVLEQVIDKEEDALSRSLKEAEEEEVCFLQMAQSLLKDRKESLLARQIFKLSFAETPCPDEAKDKFAESSTEEIKPEVKPLPKDVSFDGSKISTTYTDAFDEEESASSEAFCSEGDELSEEIDLNDGSNLDMNDLSSANIEDLDSVGVDEVDESEYKADDNGRDSPKASKSSTIADIHETLTPEEAADHLELPDVSFSSRASHQQRNNGSKPKDTYHFYQASTGQHIYMHAVNARCLAYEYGGQENGPRTVKGTIVAIERIFMSEEMRKRLRYLNHLPLTTEFHVVELKIKPPVVSKETLKHFQPEFDKRRKIRQRKAKEEKMRANKSEVEHKKAHGIYVAPEVHIPLDNTFDFPSHLASSPGAIERTRKESTNSDIFQECGVSDGQGSPKNADNAGSSPSFASFAQKLQGGPSSPPAWPHLTPSLTHSATMPEMRGSRFGPWGARDDAGGEDGGEAYQAPSMASSWMFSLGQIAPEPLTPMAAEGKSEPGLSSNGKKKKKKGKQLLFSTSMVRKT